MNKWLEYHEAVERRIMEMMRPDAPNPMYEQGWQDYTQGRYREAAGQFADSARMYEEAGAADGLNYARTLYALGELYLLWEEEDEFSDSDGVKSLSEKARKAYCDARDIYERHDLTDQQQIELSFLYDQIALEDLSKKSMRIRLAGTRNRGRSASGYLAPGMRIPPRATTISAICIMCTTTMMLRWNGTLRLMLSMNGCWAGRTPRPLWIVGISPIRIRTRAITRRR